MQQSNVHINLIKTMKRFIIPAIALLVLGACNNHSNTQNTQVSTSNTTSSVAPIEKADEEVDKEVDSMPPSCLNDIRFGDWTEDDWCDNDNFRVRRKYFDACYNGDTNREELKEYKSILKSKFAIGLVSTHRMGGLCITIIFLDNTKKTFTIWAYSYVEDGKVVGYDVRSIDIDDAPDGMTKEKILTFIKEYPEHKLW